MLINASTPVQGLSDPGASCAGDPAVRGSVDGSAEPLQGHGQGPEELPGADQRVSCGIPSIRPIPEVNSG